MSVWVFIALRIFPHLKKMNTARTISTTSNSSTAITTPVIAPTLMLLLVLEALVVSVIPLSLWGVVVGTDVVALMLGPAIAMWLVVPSTPVHNVIVTSSNITMVIWYPIIMFREV